MKSLYMNPMKVAKNPIKQNMYHTLANIPNPAFVTWSGNNIKRIEVKRIMPP